jgi:hypothetical protein
MIRLNSFESLQSLGAKSFVFSFANQNLKLKIYRIMIDISFVCVKIWADTLFEERKVRGL